MGAREIVLSSSGWGQMADFCEHGNRPSGFIICEEFLDELKIYSFFKHDPAACGWFTLHKIPHFISHVLYFAGCLISQCSMRTIFLWRKTNLHTEWSTCPLPK